MIARVPTASTMALVLAIHALDAQEAPLRLTFGTAVAAAAADAPAVAAARFRGDAADARAREASAALWPGLSAAASFTNRSFNRAALGLSGPLVPGAPEPDHRFRFQRYIEYGAQDIRHLIIYSIAMLSVFYGLLSMKIMFVLFKRRYGGKFAHAAIFFNVVLSCLGFYMGRELLSAIKLGNGYLYTWEIFVEPVQIIQTVWKALWPVGEHWPA